MITRSTSCNHHAKDCQCRPLEPLPDSRLARIRTRHQPLFTLTYPNVIFGRSWCHSDNALTSCHHHPKAASAADFEPLPHSKLAEFRHATNRLLRYILMCNYCRSWSSFGQRLDILQPPPQSCQRHRLEPLPHSRLAEFGHATNCSLLHYHNVIFSRSWCHSNNALTSCNHHPKAASAADSEPLPRSKLAEFGHATNR